MSDKADEGKSAEGDKHPETVPWNEYVGVKESLGKKLDTATQKVTSLEEQLTKAVKPEEFTKTQKELADLKATHEKVSGELRAIKEKSITEKRDFLKAKGIPEDEIKVMSEDALSATVKVLERYKPKPDLGGGSGGTVVPKGSPMELARQAYTK